MQTNQVRSGVAPSLGLNQAEKFEQDLQKSRKRLKTRTGSRQDYEDEADVMDYQRALPPELYGRPVEEVDPFVFEDTFCVIARKHGRHYVYRITAEKSLFIFGPLNPIRLVAIRILSSQWFDIFIVGVIMCNCVTLALGTNWEIGATEQMHKDPYVVDVIEKLEYVFLAIYTLELAIKTIAKGFVFNKFSYLRNRWNMLDFFVVITAYASVVVAYFFTSTQPSDDSDISEMLEIFRPMRVLRVIKTINILPGLRTMLNALISSAVQLLEVMALTLFCLCIFALLALQLFMGKLRNRCVLIKGSSSHARLVNAGDLAEYNESIDSADPQVNILWHEWTTDNKNWAKREFGYPKDEFQPCGNDSMARPCKTGFTCLPDVGIDNYDLGWINFDNFGGSLLTTFQLLTLDFWERLYDLILSTTSPWSIIFFLLVIFLGSFYLINLMLAVVSMSYETEVRKAAERPLAKHKKLSLHRTSSTFSFDKPRQLNATILTVFVKRTPEERERLARNLRESMAIKSAERNRSLPEDKPDLQSAIMMLLGRRTTMNSNPHKPAQQKSKETIVYKSERRLFVSPPEPAVVRQEPDIEAQTVPKDQLADPSSVKAEISNGDLPLSSFVRFRKKLRNILEPVVDAPGFEAAITTVIIFNTILLASEHHNQPKWIEVLSYHGAQVFIAIFTLEAVIKILALQREYFRSSWNIFDLFIVVLSFMDFWIPNNITIIRGMRILRVFKLARSWITMKVLLNIIFSTFGAVGNLVLVLVIVLYIFAVLGLQSLGKYYVRNAFGAADDEENFPRWNFQNIWFSFMMVFRLLCGEWIEPLIECFEATSWKKRNDEYMCFLIFMPVLVVGNFIVLNLFLALLLDSFDTEELQRLKQLEGSKKTDNLKKVVGMILGKNVTAPGKKNDSDSDDDDDDKTGPRRRLSKIGSSNQRGINKFRSAVKKVIMMNRKALAIRMIEKAEFKNRQMAANKRRNLDQATALIVPKRATIFDLGPHTSFSKTEVHVEKNPDPCFPRKCWSLNCAWLNTMRKRKGKCWFRFRRMVLRIVDHPFFEWMILALIFASSITLCFEDIYLPTRKQLQQVLNIMAYTFAAIFVLEMFLKWISYGLWSYFTNFWTILDFIIVMISIISVVSIFNGTAGTVTNNLGPLKALRTLRALRPLRAISRWQGMKIVVNALMYAIPSIFNVLLVCLLFWLIFSIMGVQFFKGKFYKCIDNKNGETISDQIIRTKQECCEETGKYSWVNVEPNFDNVMAGYLTLLQVATFEGWIEAMRAAVDSTDVDMQPKRDNAVYYYLFFVIFIVFGSFFTLNLFIGVIIDNFNRLKKQYEGNLLEALLTPSQRNYYAAMKKLGRKKPRKVIKRPANHFLALFYDISMSRRFEIAIFVMIFLNMINLGLETVDERKLVADILDGLNSFFTTVYAIEALVKIIGLRQFYFTQPWNIFDFVLVVASCIDLSTGGVGDAIGVPIPPTMLRVIRVFRIGRILRLIKAAKGIRKLLFALVVSLPALFNIGALLALLTFIYAVLGMALFGNIAYNSTIDEMFNFETFYRSCLLLLRVMTAAGWNDVLTAMTPITPVCGSYRSIDCGRVGEKDCANTAAAIVYLVSYLIISYLIVINMYIAVILENFVEANREEEVGIIEDDIEMFYVRWSRYDPEATQFISFDHLSDFLASLDPPLRMKKPNIVAIVAFNLPIARGNKIHCLDVLHALVKHTLGHVEDSEEMRKLQEQMEHEFRKQFPSRKLLDIISSTRIWKIQHNAAVIIQRTWRTYYARTHPISANQTKSGMAFGGRGSVNSNKKSHHAMLNMMSNIFGQGKKRESIQSGSAGRENRSLLPKSTRVSSSGM